MRRQCYKEDGSSRSPDCPVCSRSLNKLAQPLPMAHCANSRLVCKISGDVMNENNPPMMLPNGYVYGYNVRAGGGAGAEGAGPGRAPRGLGPELSFARRVEGQWRKLRSSWQGCLQKATFVK